MSHFNGLKPTEFGKAPEAERRLTGHVNSETNVSHEVGQATPDDYES